MSQDPRSIKQQTPSLDNMIEGLHTRATTRRPSRYTAVQRQGPKSLHTRATTRYTHKQRLMTSLSPDPAIYALSQPASMIPQDDTPNRPPQDPQKSQNRVSRVPLPHKKNGDTGSSWRGDGYAVRRAAGQPAGENRPDAGRDLSVTEASGPPGSGSHNRHFQGQDQGPQGSAGEIPAVSRFAGLSRAAWAAGQDRGEIAPLKPAQEGRRIVPDMSTKDQGKQRVFNSLEGIAFREFSARKQGLSRGSADLAEGAGQVIVDQAPLRARGGQGGGSTGGAAPLALAQFRFPAWQDPVPPGRDDDTDGDGTRERPGRFSKATRWYPSRASTGLRTVAKAAFSPRGARTGPGRHSPRGTSVMTTPAGRAGGPVPVSSTGTAKPVWAQEGRSAGGQGDGAGSRGRFWPDWEACESPFTTSGAGKGGVFERKWGYWPGFQAGPRPARGRAQGDNGIAEDLVDAEDEVDPEGDDDPQRHGDRDQGRRGRRRPRALAGGRHERC